ncbi:hypothetical protein ACJX0J_040608, partial [Zea mays]
DLIVLSGNCEFITLASNNMETTSCIETYEVFDVLLSLSNSLCTGMVYVGAYGNA